MRRRARLLRAAIVRVIAIASDGRRNRGLRRPRVGAPARPSRPRREPREAGDDRVPHASFTTWEPPTEQDDDAPILVDKRATNSDDAHVAPPAPAPSRERASRNHDEPHDGAEPAEDPSFAQIFVNVGRRDGARAGDLQKLLEDKAGISRDETGRIRVRDRMTFVSVKKELIEKAIAAFAGQIIGGRTVVAEVARAKP